MMKIKRLLAYVLVVTLLVTMLVMPAYAADASGLELSLKVTSDLQGNTEITKVKKGDTFYVTLSFSGNTESTNIYAFDIFLKYDSTLVSATTANTIGACSGGTANATRAEGVAKFAWANQNGLYDAEEEMIYSEGKMLRLTCKAKDNLVVGGTAMFEVSTSGTIQNGDGQEETRSELRDKDGAVKTGYTIKNASVNVVVPNSVIISSGETSIAAPFADGEGILSSTEASFSATVIGSDGNVVAAPSIQWEITPDDAGVSVENGVVTVKSNATAGEYTLKATAAQNDNTALSADASASVTFAVTKDEPVATTIKVSGGQATIAVPEATEASVASTAFTAVVYDQYGAVMSDQTVTWSVTEATGVSIADGGVVTVTNLASAGVVTITATCNGKSDTATLDITKDDPVATSMKVFYGSDAVSGTDIIGIPGSKQYTVRVYDQYGDKMDVSAGLALSSATGFSMENGLVTVASNTKNDTVATLTASYDTLDSITITITAKQVAVDWSGIALKESAEITYGDSKAFAFEKFSETGTATAYVDGQATTIDGKFTIQDADAILSAGPQSVVVVFTVTSEGAYQGSAFEQTYPITVAPKSVAVAWGTTTLPYTGAAQKPAAQVTEGLVGEDTLSITVSGEQTNIGRYSASASIAGGNANYTLTNTTVEFEIVAAPATGTVTISGIPSGADGAYRPNDTLTAAVTNGNVDQVSYQWYNKENPIEGATGTTYTLKVGDTIVYVVVTSSGNYVGMLTSETPIEVGKIPLPGEVHASVINGDGDETVNGVGDTITTTVTGSLREEEDYTVVWMRDGAEIPGAFGTKYLIAKEDQGKTISVKIIAKGDVYTGEKAADETISVAAVKPEAPVLTATAGSQKVTLRWTAPHDGGSAITGYVLTVSQAEGEPAAYDLSADVTSHEVAALTNGTEYTFALTAKNAIGTSDAGVVKATPRASSSGGGGGSTVSVTLTFDTNGGSAVTKISKPSGTVIDLNQYTSTKDGYTFEGWYRDKALTVPVTSVKLDRDLTVYAKWVAQPVAGDLPFDDVKTNDWFHDAVAYVYEKGIMNGTSTTTFSPELSTTRGMIVTMLYRMENEPDVTMENVFSDVAADQYYAAPVAWAAANGIVNGTSETAFAPDQAITREQLVAILYRYAQYKNADVSAWADLSAFADAASVSEYAVSAMQWAVGAGIVNGRGENLLAPAGTATRAEVATMIMRFVENVL